MFVNAFSRLDHGVGYYRIIQPLGELGKHGHQVKLSPPTEDRDSDGADVVIGNITTHVPWWKRIGEQAPTVYELDDDLFNLEPHNPCYREYAAPGTADDLRTCIGMASLVTCTTEYLADRMREYNPNVAVLNNCIEAYMLEHERPRRERVVIGWAGSHTHEVDVRLVVKPLAALLRKFPNTEAHFMGTDYTGLVRSDRVRFTGWNGEITGYHKSVDFDIGLAPVTKSVFNASKSHLKALEYAALGIPTVASNWHPYSDFIEDGVTGFLVGPNGWHARIRDLIEDEAMRLEMGAAAKRVASGWTIQERWPLWESAYKGLL